MTAAAKPGRREGGGTLDCRTRDLVLMAGGATLAAAVATWALVRARGDVLLGVVALRSHTTLRFRMRSRLADLVVMFVGVTGLCTLGTDGCARSWNVLFFCCRYCWLQAQLEAPAPSELVICWVFAPSELVACCVWWKMLPRPRIGWVVPVRGLLLPL